MQEFCDKQAKDFDAKHIDFSRFIVSEKYKLVFCPLPKVSCTVWKTLLADLEGIHIENDVHKEVGYKLNSLKKYSMEERRNILKTYTKFMFVREPFERFLSAYRDCFEGWYKGGDAFWKRYRQRVREYLVKNGGLRIDVDADNTTFEEFATYVVLTWRNGEKLQIHWRQMHDSCHPCHIKFDYVGHYESLSQDAEFILRKANIHDKVQFPKYRPTNTNFLMRKYYSNLTLLRIAQLQRIYKEDMELFGYTFPGPLQPVIDKLTDHK